MSRLSHLLRPFWIWVSMIFFLFSSFTVCLYVFMNEWMKALVSHTSNQYGREKTTTKRCMSLCVCVCLSTNMSQSRAVFRCAHASVCVCVWSVSSDRRVRSMTARLIRMLGQTSMSWRNHTTHAHTEHTLRRVPFFDGWFFFIIGELLWRLRWQRHHCLR